MKEKRKFKRFDIPLSVKFQPSTEAAEFCFGVTKNFSRGGLNFETNCFEHEPESTFELRVEIPQQNMFVSVLGDIVWKRRDGDKHITGIKIKAMDNEAKWDILDYGYITWLDYMRSNNGKVKAGY